MNISYPATGAQKLVDIEDEKKVRIFYDKRMGAEVEVDSLGDEWKGYVFRIAGGNDKQGFPMKQGIITTGTWHYSSVFGHSIIPSFFSGRVRLLFSDGHSCYRERRDGERRRKSVRGCIVDANLSVLAVVIVRKGEQVLVWTQPSETHLLKISSVGNPWPYRCNCSQATGTKTCFQDQEAVQPFQGRWCHSVCHQATPSPQRRKETEVSFTQDSAIGHSCRPAGKLANSMSIREGAILFFVSSANVTVWPWRRSVLRNRRKRLLPMPVCWLCAPRKPSRNVPKNWNAVVPALLRNLPLEHNRLSKYWSICQWNKECGNELNLFIYLA